MHSAGHHKDISQDLGISFSTVSSILKKFRETGSTENLPRSGRPALVKERDYRVLERIVKCNWRDSLTDITQKFYQGRNVQVTKRTIQYHLHKQGFKKRVYRKRFVLNKANRARRIAWCKEKRNWSVQRRWNKVIFSDENQIVVGEDKRVYVWRKSGEGYRPDLLPANSKNVIKLMVWGLYLLDQCRNFS